MTALRESKTPVGGITAPAKCSSKHYSLLMLNLPDSEVMKPTSLTGFFSPVPIKNYEYVLTYDPNALSTKRISRVNFFSEEDMKMALMDKQWQVNENDLSIKLNQVNQSLLCTIMFAVFSQYMGDHCIRLMTEEESAKPDNDYTWESIDRDLRLDVLSYFDVFQRARLRRFVLLNPRLT